jgi:precorrin-8X/cobalt-precorrin-8 methylmutase
MLNVESLTSDDSTGLDLTATDYSIVISGHGSRDQDGIVEFEQLVALVKKEAGVKSVEHGYLEFALPTIAQAVAKCVADGAKGVVVVPALLATATHAKNDMPVDLALLRQQFPGVDLHFAATMDLHPYLLRLCQERIMAVEAQGEKLIRRDDTCLVVVGRGTSDPDANAEIAKLTRMLEEGMGFGASFTCYSGTAKPLVKEGLATASKLGFKRIVVLPYFLFDGVLVKRIYSACDALRQRHGELEVLQAGYLGPEPLVAKVFLERAQEAIVGKATMNCSLCKYRVQILGFEEQVGMAQKAKHITALEAPVRAPLAPYNAHPIEEQSMAIIDTLRSWQEFEPDTQAVLKRLVHTAGDPGIVDDIFFSPGAADAGIRALLRCRRVVCDVTMVQSGLKRSLLEALEIDTWSGVHDRESVLLSQNEGITRSAAGIRRAWQKWGNDLVLAIGDAPTAVFEVMRLINEHNFRPQLVIALPVGFVGTRESKEAMRNCLYVPRITNSGTRGGSPWASSVVNAMMIQALGRLTES